jgi:hypothetical protein
MAEITIEELNKAARNIERISTFIGERREWSVGDGGEAMAHEIRANACALTSLLIRATGIELDPDFAVTLPPKLEPPSEISAVRLAKFSKFLAQLLRWFSSQDVAGMPEGGTGAVQKIHGSLAGVAAAVDSLFPTELDDMSTPVMTGGFGAKISGSTVIEINPNARLVLENDEMRPLLQTFEGVTELTSEAKEILGNFLVEQKIEFEPHELRRFQDKLLKWVEGIPLHQVLVIKVSGLSGRPSLYSSYQPKSGFQARENEEV